MPWTAFQVLAGVCLFQYSPQLPQWTTVLAVALASLFAMARWNSVRWLWLPLGWAWAAGSALWHEPARLPAQYLGTTLEATMVVETMPVQKRGITRFVARAAIHAPVPVPAVRVRLSWRDAPLLRVGQTYVARLRLKPAHSYRNPGSWDYAGHLYRQGIRYKGYIVDARLSKVAAAACCLLERLRQSLSGRLRSLRGPDTGKALLQTLVLGDRTEITQAMRRVASVTGVSHLLAISGLHISLAAGLAGLLVTWGWRRHSVCQRVPARVAGALAGLAVATGYALISGLGLPAQRALLMLCAGTWLLWRRRSWQAWRVFGQVLLIVLIFDPSAVLEAGFWLSFVAVAAILAMLPHVRGRPWWGTLPGIQLAVTLALYPVLFAFDMPSAPLGLIANLLLVPLFSLLLIPAAMLSTLLLLVPGGSAVPAEWVVQVLATVWRGLDWAAQWGPHWARPGWFLAVLVQLVLGVGLLLAPRGMPARGAGLVLLFTAHLPVVPGMPPGAFQLDVLDVGQGLAAVIRTRHHVMLFDTGAAYPSGFNLGDAVIVPWLRHQGLEHLDLLVLSHGDKDHAGAAPYLLRQVTADTVLSGEPGRVAVPADLCPSNYFWRWDGVRFGFIQPAQAKHFRGNNASCVLFIEGGGGRALLTGDAEARVERAMIPMLEALAPLDVVVAGHHGSATSSGQGFVSATGARHVIYSVGYRNRYHFPNPGVDRRWSAAGAKKKKKEEADKEQIIKKQVKRKRVNKVKKNKKQK